MRRLLLLAALMVAAGTGAPAAWATTVYLHTNSMTVSQQQLQDALPAFQTAVTRDLAPVWGNDATLTLDPAVPADMTLTVTDDVACTGCLGYHWLADNHPAAFVDAVASAGFNDDWRLVATHELFEMLVDPWINRFALWNHRQYLVEVCDQVESGLYAYFIDGVPISDFITPAWFGSVHGQPVDFTHSLKRPGQIGRHGYASWLRADGTWGQAFA